MSKPARTTTTGTKVQPPPLPCRDEDGRVSGARRALNYTAYDGLMQLGSDAFSAPLPPPKSERPRFAPPRLHFGWYMMSAAAGFSVGAVVLAVVFKPSLAPERPPIGLAPTADYAGSWTVVSSQPPVQMREVLEPVEPAPAPEPVAPAVAAAPAAAAVEAAAEVAAVAPPAQAATPEAEPAPVEPTADVAPAAPAPATPAVSDRAPAAHDARASRDHRHARRAASVAQLSRAQVLAAMQKVQPEVNACFRGTSGSAIADVTIIGRTGRVTTAQVSGQNGAVGSCIARAVRHATFPQFKAETLTIRYPFAH